MRKARLAIRSKSLTKTIAPIHDLEQQTKKEVEQLHQLLLEDDFTVDQLYQTVENSKQKDALLFKLNKRKLERYFADHYEYIIESQQELEDMHLPKIQEIRRAQQTPVSHNFDFKATGEEIRESSVLEIIDSFNNSLFDGDYKDGLRLLGIIKEMAASERYEKYFVKLDIADVLRESYTNWVDNCKEEEYLKTVEEIKAAIRVFFGEHTKRVVSDISAEISMGALDGNMIGRLMMKLLKSIETVVGQFKEGYRKYEEKLNVYVYSSNWIETITYEFYSIIEGPVFESDELSEILSLLNRILVSSTDMESKGISVNRVFKKLLCKDLLIHYDRFIQVVLDTFETDLKDDDNLYQIAQFYSFKTFGQELARLREAELGDVSRAVGTKKAILLINTYCLLLQPIYDKKWEFLHQRILALLCQKSSQVISNNQLQLWDHYNLSKFFADLSRGVIRKKTYNNFVEDYTNQIRESLKSIQKFEAICWDKFIQLMTQQFFFKFLIAVPKYLWDNGKIYASKEENPLKVSEIVPMMLKLWKEFFVEYIYRLSKAEIDSLARRFYDCFIYVCEYILYTAYHDEGTKDSIFLLSQSNKPLYDKTKLFRMKNIPEVQSKKVFKLAYMSLFGMKTFIIDMNAFAIGVNFFYKLSDPANPEQFLEKLLKIQQKEKKESITDFPKEKYRDVLKNFEQRLTNKEYRVSREEEVKKL